MVQPPHPWPKPPPRNHPDFSPGGLRADFTSHRGGADLFFCHGLEPKSPAAKMMAAAAKGEAGVLRALIEQHPQTPPDFKNAHGITPLMVAAARGDTAVINLLADHPLVNLSQQSRSGWTALHYAAWFDEAEAAALLLRRRAGYTQTNDAGETAFALAEGKDTEKIFWAHKPFAYDMKRTAPQHPHFAPPAPPPEDRPAQKPAAEIKSATANNDNDAAKPVPLSTLFLRAALNVGMSTTAAEGVYEQLKTDITAGENGALKDAYVRIEHAAQQAEARGKKIDFNWDGLLAVAATAGNIDALSFIAKKRDYMDSKPLTAALAALVEAAEDTPQTAEAAQWLLRWGADPNAAAKKVSATGKAGTIAYQAFARKKPMIFESFCLHAGDLKSWHVAPDQLKWEQKIEKIFAEQLDGKTDPRIRPVLDARESCIAILKIRSLTSYMGQPKLAAHLDDAIARGDLLKTMAIYAETRTSRLMRSAIKSRNLSPGTGAVALVLALKNGRTGFAKRLEADGHTLRGLQDPEAAKTLAQLEDSGSADVKRFIAANKAGEKSAPDILSIDDKYTLLRGMAARLPVSGRGFGF